MQEILKTYREKSVNLKTSSHIGVFTWHKPNKYS